MRRQRRSEPNVWRRRLRNLAKISRNKNPNPRLAKAKKNPNVNMNKQKTRVLVVNPKKIKLKTQSCQPLFLIHELKIDHFVNNLLKTKPIVEARRTRICGSEITLSEIISDADMIIELWAVAWLIFLDIRIAMLWNVGNQGFDSARCSTPK